MGGKLLPDKKTRRLAGFFFPDQNCHLYTPASFAEVLAIERMSTNLYPASFVAVWNSLVVSVKPEAQTVTEVAERKLPPPPAPSRTNSSTWWAEGTDLHFARLMFKRA